MLHSPESIQQPLDRLKGGALDTLGEALRPEALEMVEQFSAERHQAQEALMLGQHFQKRAYDRGRLSVEFEEGELVLLNLHSLSLLKSEKG